MNELSSSTAAIAQVDLAREADFALGGLIVCPSAREVRLGDAIRSVQPRVMQVLVALVRRQGEVVSRDELIWSCWEGLSVSEDAINRCIGQLRRLASLGGAEHFKIETVARVGYRLAEFDLAQKAPKAKAVAQDAERKRLPRLWLGVAAGLIAAMVLGLRLILGPLSHGSVQAGSHVAVLPFETLSDSKDVKYFSDGLSDEIISVLTTNQVPTVSRADADALRGPAREKTIERLGVAFLLSGTVESDGKQLHVRVHLDNPRTRGTVWSIDFSRDSSQAADLQAEVAAKVTDTIALAEFISEQPGHPKDDATFAAVLGSSDNVRRARGPTNWAQWVDMGREIVAAAPRFAFGHSGLALAYHMAALNGPPDRAQSMDALALSEVKRALALDPRDAAAYDVWSKLVPVRHYQEVEAIVLKGIAADGHPAAPLGALSASEGDVLKSVGRIREFLPYTRRAYSLDPLGTGKQGELLFGLTVSGKIDEAMQVLDRAVRVWPQQYASSPLRLIILAYYGSPDDALAILDNPQTRPIGLAPSAEAAWRAFLLANKTQEPVLRGKAIEAITHAASAGTLDHGSALLMLSSLGAIDAAFTEATQLSSLPNSDPSILFSLPARAMRPDPQFMELAARFGLVGYWQSTGKWPDFCAEPDLGYDCKVVAAQIAAQGAL